VLDEFVRGKTNAALLGDDGAPYQAGFCLIGPRVVEILRKLTSLDVSTEAFPPGSCAATGLAGVPVLLVRPAGEPPTIRLHLSWDLAEYVWERLFEVGRDVVPLGWEGLRVLGLVSFRLRAMQ
jgi:glycine cleavage system aminomethyltransferase T